MRRSDLQPQFSKAAGKAGVDLPEGDTEEDEEKLAAA
jgi:hypothetical protein